MTSRRLLSDAYKNHSLLVVVVALFLGNCYAKTSPNCVSSCGNIDIRRPFRVEGDPENCGNKKYELKCDHNRLVLNLFSSAKYYVQAINYGNYTIRIVDVGLQHGNCSSLPLYSLSYLNFANHKQKPYSSTLYSPDGGASLNQWFTAVALWVDCEKPVKKSPFYTDINTSASSCIGKATFSSSPSLSSGEKRHYSYFLFGYNLGGWDVADQCKIDEIVMSTLRWPSDTERNISFSDFLSDLEYGFELSWLPFFCEQCQEQGRFCEIGSNYSVTCKYHYCYGSLKKSRSFLYYFAPGYKAHGFTIIGK
ncbi:hypothetical protein RHGRI_017342 [Rhododendron griersonianum]|uniref:Wall-associated receptor kinase galacturonan-binding domain-containing protein n=1 Tax=Rhododendron griersonianum TaxID=479676 RepID=A0AAV6JXQ6_9ERIC|nr:hypothetical protein RHGRI_017342 [Rhododendron griersonianum]